MRLFLDSSALAKRYIQESGTERVLALCHEASKILLSFICVPELISAFNRLKREAKLTPKNYEYLKAEFAKDIAQANIAEFNASVLRKTIQCLEASPLRTLDAIQLACALESHCDLFVSADDRQVKAAKFFNFNVEKVP